MRKPSRETIIYPPIPGSTRFAEPHAVTLSVERTAFFRGVQAMTDAPTLQDAITLYSQKRIGL